jgi:hypothetical protein
MRAHKSSQRSQILTSLFSSYTTCTMRHHFMRRYSRDKLCIFIIPHEAIKVTRLLQIVLVGLKKPTVYCVRTFVRKGSRNVKEQRKYTNWRMLFILLCQPLSEVAAAAISSPHCKKSNYRPGAFLNILRTFSEKLGFGLNFRK